MAKVETSEMGKWVAGCFLGIAILVFLSIGCGFASDITRGEKHTHRVTVRGNYGSQIEFIRDNKEVFEMQFSSPAPRLYEGDVLSDVIYTDDKNRTEFFVKAVLEKEGPKGNQGVSTMTCAKNTQCHLMAYSMTSTN